MGQRESRGRKVFAAVLFLLMFVSIFTVLIGLVKAVDGVPYDDIGTEWNRNPNLITACTVGNAEQSTVYLENAYSKPHSRYSWFRVSDPSSSSGAVMKAAKSYANGDTLYGPYITKGRDGSTMAEKPYTVAFELRVSSNVLDLDVAYLDVCYNQGTIIKSTLVKASDFAAPNAWQSFEMPFVVPSDMIYGVEFRVINLNNGVADLLVDEIAVHRDWDSSAIYFEGALNKPQSGSSWTLVNDSSAYYGQVREAPSSSQNYGCLYGPYTKNLGGNLLNAAPLIVSFRMKVSSNVSVQAVVQIDVAFNAGTILRSEQIRADDFASRDRWQEFSMSIVAPDSLVYGLEFRVINLNNNVTDLFVDRISVAKDSSVVYSQSASDKPHSGTAWSPSMWADQTSLSGTVMWASSESSNGDMLFGPYIMTDKYDADLRGMPYVASFRMKVSSNERPEDVIYLDICYDQGLVIKQSLVRANDFGFSDTWQTFQLTFTVPAAMTYGLEFRIMNLNHGIAEVNVDKITISKDWNTATAYRESAFNKLVTGNSWSQFADSSSESGFVMKAAASSQNGGCLYGPYITTDWNGEILAKRQFTVIFKLKASNNTSSADLVYVDVAYNLGTVLQSLRIRASDFVSPNTWQNFQLTFTVPENLTYGLEFRIVNINNMISDIYADRITAT